MLTEIVVCGIIAILFGLGLGYFLFKKTTLFDFMKDRRINKILKNPENLKKKLEESGELIDNGKKISYEISQTPEGRDFLVSKTEIVKEKAQLNQASACAAQTKETKSKSARKTKTSAKKKKK